MKRLTLLIAILTLLAVPVAALAATKTYAGKTEQGYRASAKVVDGKLKWLKLKYWLDCKDADYTVGPVNEKWVDLPDGPIEQQGKHFTDSGTVEYDIGKGHKVRIALELSGDILSGGRIKATHTARARYYNSKGKQYDYCRGSIDMSLRRK